MILSTLPMTGLAALCAVLVYLVCLMRVGAARGKYDVPAPRSDGPEAFQLVMRVQLNTLEQIVFFLPVLFLFASAYGDTWGAALGATWVVSRILYLIIYPRSPSKRFIGFAPAFLGTFLALLASLWAYISTLL